MKKVIHLTKGDTFIHDGKRYEVFKVDNTFVTCKLIPDDGYTHYMYKTIEVKDETFKKNPDHKSEMH